VPDNFTFEDNGVKLTSEPNFQRVTNLVFKNVTINGEAYTSE
jgi:hypothetical protein